MIHIRTIASLEELQDAFSYFPDVVLRLKKRVDYEEYVQKLHNYACCHGFYEDGELKAFSATYINDVNTKTAFISFIGCIASNRKKGYGSKLFSYICEHAKMHGMDTLRLEVVFDNDSAIRFYQKNGMQECATTAYGYLMEKTL